MLPSHHSRLCSRLQFLPFLKVKLKASISAPFSFRSSSYRRFFVPASRINSERSKRAPRAQQMRAICDVCEAGPAQLFCAADEAALCLKCDEQVHGCNKLASKHVRLGLAEARSFPICDICENAPAFFFCGIDGTSLCLQCDMDAHTGGKKTHERYLMMGQRVEIPSQKPRTGDATSIKRNDCFAYRFEQKKRPVFLNRDCNNSDAPAVAIALGDVDMQHVDHQDSPMIDLNFRPSQRQRQDGHTKDISSSDPSSYEDADVTFEPEAYTLEMENARH